MKIGLDPDVRPPNKAILGQVVPWAPTLRALGVKPPTVETVPCTVSCPLCRNRLVIYPDVRGGVWCRCYGCKWAGDLISLGMKQWQLDAFTTIRKLDSAGVMFPDRLLNRATVERYQDQVLNYRATIKAFWDTASRYPFQDNVVTRRLHEQFGLRSDYDPKRWAWQLGKFVGASNVVSFVSAAKMSDVDISHGIHQTFRGSGWDEILTIPSWDMPGRIAGFWFVGREGRLQDWIYFWTDLCRVRAGWGSPKDEREAGLAFFDPDHIYHTLFHDTWFVVGDPVLALKLHGRYFRDHGDYLPLVLAYEGAEGYARRVWQCLEKRDWVFWSPYPSREVFAQAQAANGRVCICPFDDVEDLRRSVTWLRRVRSQARPWREALLGQLPHLSDADLETILLHLDTSHQDAWNAFVKPLPLDTRLRLETCRRRVWPNPLTHVGGIRVVVRPEGWFVERSGELITDVHLEVIAVFAKRLAGAKRYAYYVIKCRYRGREWHLCEPTRGLRGKLCELLEEAAVKRGLEPPRFSPIWRHRLFDIAYKMSNPKIVRAHSRKAGRKSTRVDKVEEEFHGPNKAHPG